jgi:hypothetical protein
MRAVALIAVASLTTSCAHRAPSGGVAEPAAVAAPSIRVEYQKPQDPAHEQLYDAIRHRRVLEHVAEAIAVIRLPRPLTLVFSGCDGISNAYYLESTATITFCYEYLADIERAAEAVLKAQGASHMDADAVDGPVVFVLFHEAAHAVFHLLQVPVLGKEEDAADSFAAMSLLRMGDHMCHRMLRGAAWAYRPESQPAELDISDFSDVHSLDAQRYYNILCLAYGSDQKGFADALTSGMLPEERAAGCGAEFQQARYAIQKLILPSIDTGQLDRLLMKHGARRDTASRAPKPANRSGAGSASVSGAVSR